MDIIIDCIKEGSYAKAADIIRAEKYLAGIYLDTDIKYAGLYKPFLPKPYELNMKYGIQTSFELDPPNGNCLLVVPYKSKIMKEYRYIIRKNVIKNRYSIKPEISSITKTNIFVSEESMNLERDIMSSTGPYALSEAINNLSSEDNPIYVLRNNSNIEYYIEKFKYSLHQIATWISELRKKFNYEDYEKKLVVEKIARFIQLCIIKRRDFIHTSLSRSHRSE